MPMHSQAFLDLLDQQGILSPMDIESLREQVVAADSPIHPVFVARRLVTAGYLNPYHAKTLLSELAQAVRGTPHKQIRRWLIPPKSRHLRTSRTRWRRLRTWNWRRSRRKTC